MYHHFLSIKKKYDDFYRKLMKDGLLPMRSTEKGFWSASISHEIYSLFERIKLEKSERFLDLGSGDGSVVLIASLFGPKAVGIEYDEWLFQVAERSRRELSHLPKVASASFIQQDYLGYPIHAFDTVFINPDAPFYRGVESKLLRELKGQLIVYGSEFWPQHLRQEERFVINGTPVGIFKNK